MRHLLFAIVFLCWLVPAKSAELGAATRARVAAALSQASLIACYCDPECSCPCGPDCPCGTTCYIKTSTGIKAVKRSDCGCTNCNCTNGQCGSPNCPTLPVSTTLDPGPLEWAAYLLKYNQALAANKPLVIWVGEACPPCEASWTQYVHAHLSDYCGETGPEVIVGCPDNLGGMTIAGRINNIPQLSQIQNVLAPVRTQTARQAFYVPQHQPMFQPMMMGGFGVFGGGGCSSCH